MVHLIRHIFAVGMNAVKNPGPTKGQNSHWHFMFKRIFVHGQQGYYTILALFAAIFETVFACTCARKIFLIQQHLQQQQTKMCSQLCLLATAVVVTA